MDIFAGGDAIAEKDARETFRQNNFATAEPRAMARAHASWPQPIASAPTIGYWLVELASLT